MSLKRLTPLAVIAATLLLAGCEASFQASTAKLSDPKLASAVDAVLPMRADTVTDGDCQADVTANAPAPADGFFTVPKVVE